MSKKIEQTFTLALDNTSIHITARNYNTHQFMIAFQNGERAEGVMTADQMKRLSSFLEQVAQEIQSDKDFKSIGMKPETTLIIEKVAIPKQQESEEGEFELLLQLQSAFRDIEKLSFKEAMKAKEELLTHYSIKRK